MAPLGKHWKLSNETKERMRVSKLGSKNPMFGKTPESKNGVTKKCFCGESFYVKKSHLSFRKTCSRKCNSILRYKKGEVFGFRKTWIENPDFMKGKNSPRWKGEKVSYRNLHRWVERLIGKPNKCEYCGKIGYGRQMHWANKSREYKRILTDWLRLCAKCHKAYDLNLINK